MACKQVELGAKIKECLKELEELRTKRSDLIHKRNQLEDEIKEVRTDQERKETERKVNSFAGERDANDKEIEKCEKELEELRAEQKRLNDNAPKLNPGAGESGRNGGNYRGMENIVLRSNESLFERKNFSPEEKGLNLGKYVRGMVTGRWQDAEQERAAMLTSGANALIPAPLYSNIVDKARNLSVFTASGVPTVVMETNNLTVAKIKEDLQVAFKAEGEKATESTPLELEGVTLNSKTIYGYAYVSMEAIQSAQNLDAILTDSFGKAVAEGIDQGMLYGVYSGTTPQEYAPAGIFNNTDINTIAASTSDYDDVVRAIGQIRANNGVATTMAMNANTEQVLSLLKDKNGQYLTPPKAITDVSQIVSNQLAYDAAAGSDILVFDPSALLIGVQMGVNVKVFDGDTASIERGLVCFRIASMIDCVVLQPKHISRITGFGKDGE